jgi:tRNA nucleotidyltransferase (CCA-adding enzyme)
MKETWHEKNEITIPVPEPVREILKTLENAGYEAFAVGGCVRDSLLGRTPKDWDITTSARPREVKALFRRTVDTGIKHGTVTVLIGKTGYEITTYRIDGDYADGRHPDQVYFTPSLTEDLKRRDFTINAMAYSPAVGLVDEFDGVGDLRRRVIRCVGVPRERFTEDALRILRAIRFSAQLGFAVEKETEDALAEIAPNLVHVSRERIQVELTKTLLSDHPEKMLEVHETGMDRYIGQEFAAVFAGKTELLRSRLAAAAALPAEKALRWAAFLAGSGPEITRKVLQGLKMDRDTIRDAEALTGEWKLDFLPDESAESPGTGSSAGPGVGPCPGGSPEPGGDAAASGEAAVRREMSRMSDALFDRLLLLGGTICPENREKAENIRRMAEDIRRRGDCYRMKDMAVTGGDLIQAGMKPGRGMGEALDACFALVLRDPAANDRGKLLEYALNFPISAEK